MNVDRGNLNDSLGDVHQFLSHPFSSRPFSTERRIVININSISCDINNFRHINFKNPNAEAPLASEINANVSTKQAERIDFEIEGSENAEELSLDTAISLGTALVGLLAVSVGSISATTKVEARTVYTDANCQNEETIFKANVF